MKPFRPFVTIFSRFWRGKRNRDFSQQPPKEIHSSFAWDTKTAIEELTKIAKKNIQDHELFLALGNLYRFQGDIEKAIRIRYNLISRPYLTQKTRGKIFFELAIDYKRGGFFDRAILFLEKAKELLGDDPAILTELMELNALVKEFDKSAAYSKILKNPVAYAHFKVEQSRLELEKANREVSESLLQEAIEAYPASIEAWSEMIVRDYDRHLWDDLYLHTKKGLKKVSPEQRFVLIESLIQHILKKKKSDLFSPIIIKEGAESIIKALKKYPKDSILLYYLAWFYLQIRQKEKALEALRQSIIIDPGFWLARIELVHLLCDNLKDLDSFKKDLSVLINEGRCVKRFICSVCSFKTNTLFFICPRCHSWHSIRFRRYISR